VRWVRRMATRKVRRTLRRSEFSKRADRSIDWLLLALMCPLEERHQR
jgi:hypothetical protein